MYKRWGWGLGAGGWGLGAGAPIGQKPILLEQFFPKE